MKVLLHALGATMGGATRHLNGFLPELGKADRQRDYTLLVRESLIQGLSDANIHIEAIPDLAATSWLRRVRDDMLTLPRRLRREKYSAIVSLTNFGPVWAGVPHIVFQRNSLYYCPYFLSRIHGRLKAEVLLRRRMAQAMMAHAARVVTPSRSMAEMILNHMPSLPKERLRTLYHGFDTLSMSAELDPNIRASVAQAHGAKVLYPSHLSFYKGFSEMFELLAYARRDGLSFTLFLTVDDRDDSSQVREYKQRVKALGLQNDIRWLGRVRQAEMGALYRCCDAMLFPSRCESFGFPLLEALAHRLPVIAADTNINREICGNAAVYFQPDEPRSASKVLIDALLAQNTFALVRRGQARLQEFDWGWCRYAREFVALVDEVVNSRAS